MANRIQRMLDNIILTLASVFYYAMYAILIYLFFVNCSNATYYALQENQTYSVYFKPNTLTQVRHRKPLFTMPTQRSSN